MSLAFKTTCYTCFLIYFIFFLKGSCQYKEIYFLSSAFENKLIRNVDIEE